MTPTTKPIFFSREHLRPALIVTRREMQESWRDWRIVVPIILLTFGFPMLIHLSAEHLVTFITRYGGNLAGEKMIPILLLIVGFFPTSFCLVIALETFVGEKERQTLEPLLATPLSNLQLYMGKMAAALILPLLSSYVGMGLYTITAMGQFANWQLSPIPLLQVVLLTTVQAIMMIAAAVIVSSQVTSVRAANLLASFIIVPMTLLLQAEAVALLWGNLRGLWWLLLGITVTTGLLLRMGIQIFNREQLLRADIDRIELGWAWRQFWSRFSGRTASGRYPSPLNWYRATLALLPQIRLPATVLLTALVGALLLGIVLAQTYQLPPTLQEAMANAEQPDHLREIQRLASQLPLTILIHNLRAIIIAAILGAFTFGVLGILAFILPWAFIGFLAAQLASSGINPIRFFLATVVPHGLVEVPALLLAGAAALRWHTVLIAPALNRSISAAWLTAAADFGRLFVALVLPLLCVASLIEAYITPLVLWQLYGP